MYIKSIELQNTGPIENFKIQMPFDGDCPKPVILVGPNGSGKSTVISFIVNALITFKQRAIDNAEVESGRVYRIRSPLGIKSGENYFHADLKFEHNLRLQEWQLDRSRETFERELGWTPLKSTWMEIPEYEISHFAPDFSAYHEPHKMETILNSNCLLFFPADRFEPPDWLNAESLSSELKMPSPTMVRGQSQRRIFSRNRLKPTLEWLTSVLLDMLLSDHRTMTVPLQATPLSTPLMVSARIPVPGLNSNVFNSVLAVLREILAEQPEDTIQFELGDRRSRIVSIHISRKGKKVRTIKDLLSLSAGESALFSLFASIILDADLARMPFNGSSEIRGLVLIDEADLHLHLGLQYKVFPRLIALFNRIQFVMTVHSPLAVLGMESVFGSNGFTVLEMPTGTAITPESYSEFLNAFDVLSQTRKFQTSLLAQARTQSKPVLLLEGKTDAELIELAWSKLHPGVDIPFTAIGCGADAGHGGAKTLNSALRYLTSVFEKKVIGIFDNDREGAPQFQGLKEPDFLIGIDSEHKRHSVKNINVTLLPTPPGREHFVPPNQIHRLLAIEHYFSDSILSANGMMGTPIYPGTAVFEISGDKAAFARRAAAFSPEDFNNFSILFTRIQPWI